MPENLVVITGQLADKPTYGLPTRGLARSQNSQLVDAAAKK